MPEEKEEAGAPAKSNKKLFVIAGVVFLLIIAAGAAFYFMSSKGSTDAHEAPAKHGEKSSSGGGHGGEVTAPQVHSLEPFIVNLMNASGNRYLKVTVSMEVDGPILDEITAKTAQIRDSIIILLSSKDYSDVGSVPGKYQLRDEIASRVNMILTTGRVKSVYFTEFVIQ